MLMGNLPAFTKNTRKRGTYMKLNIIIIYAYHAYDFHFNVFSMNNANSLFVLLENI